MHFAEEAERPADMAAFVVAAGELEGAHPLGQRIGRARRYASPSQLSCSERRTMRSMINARSAAVSSHRSPSSIRPASVFVDRVPTRPLDSR
jgi:hypothetical protein